MPTNRTRRTRKIQKISFREIHYLQFGATDPNDTDEEWECDVFLKREEDWKALWELHRVEVLRTWTGTKKPWAAKFDNE